MGENTTRPELRAGGRTCQCECGEYFTGLRPFDRHQISKGTDHVKCLTPAQMRKIGMTQNQHGVWSFGERTERKTEVGKKVKA